MDQDPQFTNPANGNYTLRSTSPLIDRGDPDSALEGLDIAGASRLNDGDLDHVMILDIGAYEFSHVELELTGDPQPGGQLTIDVTGTPGMGLFLAAGPPAPAQRLDPYGLLFFDLAAARVRGFGTTPRNVTFTVPPTLPTPQTFSVQVLALGSPLPSGGLPGNVSNPVFVTVE